MVLDFVAHRDIHHVGSKVTSHYTFSKIPTLNSRTHNFTLPLWFCMFLGAFRLHQIKTVCFDLFSLFNMLQEVLICCLFVNNETLIYEKVEEKQAFRR